MNHRITALAAITAAPLLMAAGCVPTPGWEGTGTIVELEHINPDHDNGDIESDGLEVTVITENGREDNAMFAPTGKCEDALNLGDTVTLDQVIEHCGPADWSDDD